MAVTVHNRTVSLLQRAYPEARTSGFGAAVRALPHIDTECHLRPDLWWVDEPCLAVVCIEVEDAYPINGAKLDCYTDLWWDLDDYDFALHLLRSDRWGELKPVPLFDLIAVGAGGPHHRLPSVIKNDQPAICTVAELTSIYCIHSEQEREAKRASWMAANPAFCS